MCFIIHVVLGLSYIYPYYLAQDIHDPRIDKAKVHRSRRHHSLPQSQSPPLRRKQQLVVGQLSKKFTLGLGLGLSRNQVLILTTQIEYYQLYYDDGRRTIAPATATTATVVTTTAIKVKVKFNIAVPSQTADQHLRRL